MPSSTDFKTGYDKRNKQVLGWRRKAARDWEVAMSTGSSFQSLAAATGNARSPTVTSRVGRTSKASVADEGRRQRKGMSATRVSWAEVVSHVPQLFSQCMLSRHDVKLHPHRVMSKAWRETASTVSLSPVAFCTDVLWGRPVRVSSYTVVCIYESWSYLILHRFLALIAFLCWCAIKQSINKLINHCLKCKM